MGRDRRVEQFDVRDKSTGQVFDMYVVPKFGDRRHFMKVYPAYKKELMKRCWGLQGFTHKVLSYLEAAAGWKNEIPRPSELAKELELWPNHIYRAYADLKKAGVVLEFEGRYYLDPNLCWKGTEAQLEEAYQTVFRPLYSAHDLAPLTIAEPRANYALRRRRRTLRVKGELNG